jgi:hypothetical protein
MCVNLKNEAGECLWNIRIVFKTQIVHDMKISTKPTLAARFFFCKNIFQNASDTSVLGRVQEFSILTLTMLSNFYMKEIFLFVYTHVKFTYFTNKWKSIFIQILLSSASALKIWTSDYFKGFGKM